MDAHNVTLPNELWLSVASYLPDETVAQLWMVNRVFLAVALDAKYRYVRLFRNETHTFKETVMQLQHLTQPYILERIMVLEINSQYTCPYDATIQLSKSGTPLRIAHAVSQKLGEYLSPNLRSAHTIHQLSHELILNLPNLRSLVVCDVGHGNPLCFSLASNIWRLQTQNPEMVVIRHLTLDVRPDDLDHLLPTSPSNHSPLPHLESLNLIIHRSSHYSADGLEALHTFLNLIASPAALPFPAESRLGDDLKPRLKLLHIRFRAVRWQHWVFKTIFQRLCSLVNSLPNMTHFSLSTLPYSIPWHEPAFEFLKHHKDKITHLRITAHSRRAALPPKMSALQHLEIEGAKFQPNIANTVQAYVLQSTKRFKSLTINDYPLNFYWMGQVLNVFPSSQDSLHASSHNVRLRTVTLHLLTLTPQHFDYLFDHLPYLEELNLRIFLPNFPFRGHGDAEPSLLSLEIKEDLTHQQKQLSQERFFDELQTQVFYGMELGVVRVGVAGVEEHICERMRQALHVAVPSLLRAEVGNGIVSSDSEAFRLPY